jgi:hypothetical protein
MSLFESIRSIFTLEGASGPKPKADEPGGKGGVPAPAPSGSGYAPNRARLQVGATDSRTTGGRGQVLTVTEAIALEGVVTSHAIIKRLIGVGAVLIDGVPAVDENQKVMLGYSHVTIVNDVLDRIDPKALKAAVVAVHDRVDPPPQPLVPLAPLPQKRAPLDPFFAEGVREAAAVPAPGADMMDLWKVLNGPAGTGTVPSAPRATQGIGAAPDLWEDPFAAFEDRTSADLIFGAVPATLNRTLPSFVLPDEPSAPGLAADPRASQHIDLDLSHPINDRPARRFYGELEANPEPEHPQWEDRTAISVVFFPTDVAIPVITQTGNVYVPPGEKVPARDFGYNAGLTPDDIRASRSIKMDEGPANDLDRWSRD